MEGKGETLQRWLHQDRPPWFMQLHALFFLWISFTVTPLLLGFPNRNCDRCKREAPFEGSYWGKGAIQFGPRGRHHFPAWFSSSWMRLNILKGTCIRVTKCGLRFCPFEFSSLHTDTWVTPSHEDLSPRKRTLGCGQSTSSASRIILCFLCPPLHRVLSSSFMMSC